jgi:hypothetical protein
MKTQHNNQPFTKVVMEANNLQGGGVCGMYHLLLLSVYLHALPGSVTYFTSSLLE